MKYTLQFEHISSVELQKLIEFLSLHKYDFSPLPNDGKPLVKSWFARLWERFDKFGDACINSLGSQIERG